MKESPQEDCTNCTKGVTHWCVCKKCRNNARIVERIRRKIKKLEGKPNTGIWYLNEWKAILGKAK